MLHSPDLGLYPVKTILEMLCPDLLCENSFWVGIQNKSQADRVTTGTEQNIFFYFFGDLI
jgi:hypothetical protein